MRTELLTAVIAKSQPQQSALWYHGTAERQLACARDKSGAAPERRLSEGCLEAANDVGDALLEDLAPDPARVELLDLSLTVDDRE